MMTRAGPPTTLLVIAKQPRPGYVKTRLTPPFTLAQAAALAEAALADTLQAVRRCPARRRVLVLDGTPGRWLPPGVEVIPQAAGGLDERLAEAFSAVADSPALLVGADTPQLTPQLLAPALVAGAWQECDAWFGPATDGGFWALGLAAPDPTLLSGVPMSTPHTGTAQRRRLTTAGLRVRDLPPLRDVDTAPDAIAVAAAAPRSHFANLLESYLPATRPFDPTDHARHGHDCENDRGPGRQRSPRDPRRGCGHSRARDVTDCLPTCPRGRTVPEARLSVLVAPPHDGRAEVGCCRLRHIR
jgi:glycosyltransferase A (GT-A) superfamily protein (DUF2064 family)